MGEVVALTVRVRISTHHGRIAAAMRDPSGPAARFVEARCQLTENYAKYACPVRDGRLRNSITHRVYVDGDRIVGDVFSPLHYARYVHEGTGIYGPRRQFIYPKRGSVMVFEVRGGHGPLRAGQKRPAPGRGNVVFARRVRGTPATPFLTQGLELANPDARIRYHDR